MSHSRVVNVDVVVRAQNVTAQLSDAIPLFLAKRGGVSPGEVIIPNASFATFVEVIRICDLTPGPITDLRGIEFNCFFHGLHAAEVIDEPLHDGAAEDGAAESLPACELTAMPNRATDGLWESLHYAHDVKSRLLGYARTCMLFSRVGVDPNEVAFNRIVLLHGPPGTGKTSLCKALAHKLSIRMRHQFHATDLVEINAHSLFSKWFSESGKQVMQLFRRIRDMADDPRCLVCVLIDEVESLAAARTSAANGNEPSDAIRVVNALLTQLDALRRLPNVLVLATSNITGCIDLAFVDRADLKIFIGPPPEHVKVEILSAAVRHLIARGLVAIPLAVASGTCESVDACIAVSLQPIVQHMEAAASASGISVSGRSLRKLPLLAFVHGGLCPVDGEPTSFEAFIAALQVAAVADAESRSALTA